MKTFFVFIFAAISVICAGAAPLFTPDLASLKGNGVTLAQGAAPDGSDALVFDGSSEYGLSLRLPESIKAKLAGDEVSASLWIRVDKQSDSDIALGFTVKAPYYETAPVQLNLKTLPTNFGTYPVFSFIEHRVVFGAWHHVAFSHSLSNLSYTVYFDGMEQYVQQISADMPSPIDIASLFRPLGAHKFKGAVASLKIWNRALGRDELLAFKPSAAELEHLASAFAAQSVTGGGFAAACGETAKKLRQTAASGCDVKEWQTAARIARDLPRLAAFAKESAGILPAAPFTAAEVDAYSAEKHLPFVLTSDAKPMKALSIALAKGEFEASSFMLYPLKAVKSLDIKARALTSSSSTLPTEALDIRVVKCWYTPFAGWNTYFGGGREFPCLAPELLLHDDALVVADTAKRRNFLRVDYKTGTRAVDISRPGVMSSSSPFNYVSSPVRDTKGPMPANLSLKTGEAKQFWITVHAPENATPGTYRADIVLVADGQPAGKIPFTAEIRPYTLPVARTRYNLTQEYLGGMMNHCGLETQLEMGKSIILAERRFETEMRNMAEHNILHPFGPSFSDEKKLQDTLAERQFNLMRKAGCSLDFVFGGGPAFEPSWLGDHREGSSPQKNPELYEKFDKRFEQRIRHTARRFDEVLGHRNACFYGLDEAGPATVRDEFRFFAILHKYGFKAFITSGVAEYANFIVDYNDYPAGIRDSAAARWHAAGAHMLSYAAPFTGPENPETWRRNKGVRMYYANFDGIAEYVWYEGFNIWNEFIVPAKYKNFNIVYPTADGVLDTVAWEALREGFDDVRYATLLRLLGADAMRSADAALAEKGRETVFWLETSDPETMNLDEFRRGIADRIALLRKAGAKYTEPPRASVAAKPLASPKEVFVKPDAELKTFDALCAEAARLKAANFCDLSLPLLTKAVAMTDADPEKRTNAKFELADVCRLLSDDATATAVFKEILTDRNAAPDVVGRAYAGLMKTLLNPSEYDWKPMPAQLDEAQKIYDEANARRIPVRAKTALLDVMAAPFILGGRGQRLIDLCEAYLAGDTLKGEAANALYEHEGDAYAALGQYAKAVARYDRVVRNPANKFRILEKTGDNARLAKNFRKAQQAYSDLLPMIDKEESASLYNRISRIVVSLTKATHESTKQSSDNLDLDGGFDDLSLDD